MSKCTPTQRTLMWVYMSMQALAQLSLPVVAISVWYQCVHFYVYSHKCCYTCDVHVNDENSLHVPYNPSPHTGMFLSKSILTVANASCKLHNFGVSQKCNVFDHKIWELNSQQFRISVPSLDLHNHHLALLCRNDRCAADFYWAQA